MYRGFYIHQTGEWQWEAVHPSYGRVTGATEADVIAKADQLIAEKGR